MQGVSLSALAKPFRIVPGIIEVPHHRCCARRLLHEQSNGISFIHSVPVLIGYDVVLVHRSLSGARNEPLPDAATSTWPKWMRIVIPAIETADHTDIPRIGGPDAKGCTLHAI